ncbi:MAG: TIM barrel protein, partial [Planctomycetaceae bacterium]|nr:TIM barrel protein [Planctomycetaceae bacterium]
MSAFRYSLNSSTIKTTPILQKIAVAAEAGFEGIELWHDDIDQFLAEGGTLQQLRQSLQTSGLKVPTTIHLKQWFQSEGDEYAQAIQDAHRKFEQAAAVGAEFTVAGPPHGHADRALGAERYHHLLEIGRKYGVRPAFEYLGFVEDIKTIDDAI